jgi:hypothetical protein
MDADVDILPCANALVGHESPSQFTATPNTERSAASA